MIKKKKINSKQNSISFLFVKKHIYYYIYLLNEQKISINYCYSVGYRVIRKWYPKLYIQTNELKD